MFFYHPPILVGGRSFLSFITKCSQPQQAIPTLWLQVWYALCCMSNCTDLWDFNILDQANNTGYLFLFCLIALFIRSNIFGIVIKLWMCIDKNVIIIFMHGWLDWYPYFFSFPYTEYRWTCYNSFAHAVAYLLEMD